MKSKTGSRLPNFIIIGAGKSGSTSIYHYIKQHPDIFMCNKKEPGFFDFDGIRPTFNGPKDEFYVNSYVTHKLEDYLALFQEAGDEQIIGEASVRYLSSQKAPVNISKYIPDVKLIAILRNPIERAFSGYMMAVRDARENLGFMDALKDELAGNRTNWSTHGYMEAGKYYKHLTNYLRYFRPHQIKVCLYDDLKEQHRLVREIFEFLEVDAGFTPSFATKYNASGHPKLEGLHKFLTNLDDTLVSKNRRLNHQIYKFSPSIYKLAQRIYRKGKSSYYQKALHKVNIDDESRAFLQSIYQLEIMDLQKLIDRDLTHWLKAP